MLTSLLRRFVVSDMFQSLYLNFVSFDVDLFFLDMAEYLSVSCRTMINDIKKMIKEKTVSLVLFLNFFFSVAVVIFVSLCTSQCWFPCAPRMCCWIFFFFFLPSILCKVAHGSVCSGKPSFTFFFRVLSSEVAQCVAFFYCPCSSRSCCERLCAYVRSFNVFVQVHRTFFSSSRSRSLGQKC